MKRLPALAGALAFVVPAATAGAETYRHDTVESKLVHQIVYHRMKTWHLQDRAHRHRSHTSYRERHVDMRVLPRLKHYWEHRHYIAWRTWKRTQLRQLASAPSVGYSGWDRVAACESGGNWSLVTGNGFYWGLQWLPSTWDGRAIKLGFPSWKWFTDRSSAPSREMQIAAASTLSLSNWPICGARY